MLYVSMYNAADLDEALEMLGQPGAYKLERRARPKVGKPSTIGEKLARTFELREKFLASADSLTAAEREEYKKRMGAYTTAYFKGKLAEDTAKKLGIV